MSVHLHERAGRRVTQGVLQKIDEYLSHEDMVHGYGGEPVFDLHVETSEGIGTEGVDGVFDEGLDLDGL